MGQRRRPRGDASAPSGHRPERRSAGADVARVRRRGAGHGLPTALVETTFEAVILDWYGTAVSDRQADASRVRARVEELCAMGVHVFVVGGAHIGDIDGQLAARPAGPGHLHLCVNRGSEVFAVTAAGPSLVWRRAATVTAQAAGLAGDRMASDVRHLDIGLADKADSARWAAAWLAARGVTGGLVLVVG